MASKTRFSRGERIIVRLPVVGRILFEQNAVIYLTLPIFFLVQHVLFKTTAGLRLRAVGENPAAAEGQGLSVAAVRYAAITAGSAKNGGVLGA